MELKKDLNNLQLNADGFLRNSEDWNQFVAEFLAKQEAIELSEAHWEILNFIRQYYFKFKHLPNSRMFISAIRRQLGEDKGNSLYLHRLFPQGPLKYACKIAGLPKPPTCL
jgi:tRNA 2-thiouridine synthesizing protein E